MSIKRNKVQVKIGAKSDMGLTPTGINPCNGDNTEIFEEREIFTFVF